MAEREIKLSMSTFRWLVGGLLALMFGFGNGAWALYSENQEMRLELRLVALQLESADASTDNISSELEALR